MSGLFDLAAIRRDHLIPPIAGTLVKLQRTGREWKACCPFHQDRSPSFTIFDGGRRFQCFGCGAQGDVLDFVQRSQGVSLREAAAMIGANQLPVVSMATAPAAEPKEDRRDEAISIWRAAGPAKGTPVDTYLRSRALILPIPASIRFARLRYGKIGPFHPVMVALVASVDDRAIGVQRTYLNAAGTGKAAVPNPKLSLGNVRGGAIRLAPCARTLTIAEGIEDGLSLQQEPRTCSR
jgi:DNA primase